LLGSYSSFSVQINPVRPNIPLSNGFPTVASMLKMLRSYDGLIARNFNELDSVRSDHVKIECLDNPNVRLVSFEKGSLSIVGGSDP
jgi:hypothetical protein